MAPVREVCASLAGAIFLCHGTVRPARGPPPAGLARRAAKRRAGMHAGLLRAAFAVLVAGTPFRRSRSISGPAARSSAPGWHLPSPRPFLPAELCDAAEDRGIAGRLTNRESGECSRIMVAGVPPAKKIMPLRGAPRLPARGRRSGQATAEEATHARGEEVMHRTHGCCCKIVSRYQMDDPAACGRRIGTAWLPRLPHP